MAGLPLREADGRLGDLLCHARIVIVHQAFPRRLRMPRAAASKKSRRGGTPRRYSTTPAYSSTSPPVKPGCPSSSRPTTSALIVISGEGQFPSTPSHPPLSRGERE